MVDFALSVVQKQLQSKLGMDAVAMAGMFLSMTEILECDLLSPGLLANVGTQSAINRLLPLV